MGVRKGQLVRLDDIMGRVCEENGTGGAGGAGGVFETYITLHIFRSTHGR
jgi:hypothetical protein